MTGIMCQMLSGGISDTQIVTVGFYFDPSGLYSIYGYSATSGATPSPAGAINDGTFNPLSGATITELSWWSFSAGSSTVVFQVNGTFPNGGWSIMDISGTQFTRNLASSFSNTGGVTQWTWNTATNPFGSTTGVPKTITFS